MIGLTSITFRELSVEEIIKISVEAGIDGIEWGGDVHVPAGNIEVALKVKQQTLDAGLKNLSYGSYYKLKEEENFLDTLNSAVALHVPCIRIWAGEKASENSTEEDYLKLGKKLNEICKLALEKNITIALEYHRNTLTDNYTSTLKLLEIADSKNLKTYWQPNPDINLEERLTEIENLLEYITNIHVFNWEVGNIRYLMSEINGEEIWSKYLEKIKNTTNNNNFILEFVKDNSIENFYSDIKSLKKILK